MLAALTFLRGLMTPGSVSRKLIISGGLLLGFVLFLGLIHHAGRVGGEKDVQDKWDKAVASQKSQVLALQNQLHAREDLHRQETARITDTLRKTEADHETAIATLRVDTAQRLLNSQRRAASYSADAEAGGVACRDLASRTAQFDRALEEGRSLVVEFGSTVRLRDSQLQALGAVIANDRKTLGGS